jgi:DNA-binding NarL/FixJ family response regulator
MKRIFMLSSHALFCEGIESLLRSDSELEFIGQDADVKNGIKRINELQPDVVILDDGSPIDNTPLVTLTLQQLLGRLVIGLNLRENVLYAHGERRVLTGPDDLRQAITNPSRGKRLIAPGTECAL